MSGRQGNFLSASIEILPLDLAFDEEVLKGAVQKKRKAIEEIEEGFQAAFKINVLGTITLTKLLTPFMLKRGGGHFVVMSSAVRKCPAPGQAIYSASKHALNGYFHTLHSEVEHPITEWIAEVNLPVAQVVVGMGIPLWKIPEIRRFYGMNQSRGYDAWKNTSVAATIFDFDKAKFARPKGHCVVVRVTTEDPGDGFKPTSGKVL